MGNSDKSARKALLKAWKQGEQQSARSKFPLDDDTLGGFFDGLDELVDSQGCSHDTRHTGSVIAQLGLTKGSAEKLLNWCRSNGGHCDCEIISNTYDHWDQNRVGSAK
jgi:hypothetical protein